MSVTFRPSLTLHEVALIIGCLPRDETALIRKLQVFTLKAEHGITKAAHVRTGVQTKAAALGFEEDATMEALVSAYESNPEALSVRQTARVREFRYLTDAMSPEEELQYEQDTFKIPG